MAKLNTFSFRQLPRLRNGARRNGSVSSAGLMRLRAGTSMAALFIPAGFLDADTPFLHEDEGRFPALQAAGPRPRDQIILWRPMRRSAYGRPMGARSRIHTGQI